VKSGLKYPIADHELVEPIASGSYGDVWLARNAVGTLRAVKIVSKLQFEREEDFERELKGLQNFEPVSRSHDGLVDVLQIGRQHDWFYYVMELADNVSPIGSGKYIPHTLRHDLRVQGKLDIDAAIDLGLSLCSALHHLHEHGLIHRDVKPSNILFIGGVAKLADAGLVAAVDDARSLVGTTGYIAPEGPGSIQADIFSLGKALYEVTFGKDRQDFPQLPMNLAANPDHKRLLELNEIIVKACAHNCRNRYRNASAMRIDLQLLARGGSVKWQHFRVSTGKVLIKAGAALALLLLISAAALALGDRFGWRATPQQSKPTKMLAQEAQELARLGWIENVRISHAGIENAERLFHEALDKNPDCIPAHRGLANLHDYATDWHFPPRKTWPLVKKHAQKLLELKADDSTGHRELGRFQFYYEWDFTLAEASFRKAINLDPDAAEFHSDLATLLLVLDRRAEAREELQEVRRLTLPNVGGYFTLGWSFYTFRDYGQAVDFLRKSIDLDKTFINSRFALGWVLMDMGRYNEALHEVTNSYQEDKIDPEFLCVHAQLLAATHDREAASKIADQLQPLTPTTWYISPYHNARLQFTLGNTEKGWDYLDQAVEDRSSRLLTLPTDKFWDPYRSNSRFKTVLQRIGLLGNSEPKPSG
jgi:serine/threonine protein kinase/Tfp pilus assembly protein PilF